MNQPFCQMLKTLLKKPKLLISTILALSIVTAIVVFSPLDATAEYWKQHDMPEISGSLAAGETIQENIEMEKIHFSVATAVAENAVTDGQAIKGKLGAVQGFLVYKFGIVDGDGLFHKVIVDAGNGFTLYISEGKSIDDFKHYSHGDKWSQDKMIGSHYKMMDSHFADLTPEEREAKIAQHTEMKEAFTSLSEEDRETIMAHFKDMKTQYANLSDEERTAKHTEMKTMMEEFMQLTLDEKIEKLTEFANSLRSN